MERQKELIGPTLQHLKNTPITANCISSFPLSLCFNFAEKNKKQTSPHKITLITVY